MTIRHVWDNNAVKEARELVAVHMDHATRRRWVDRDCLQGGSLFTVDLGSVLSLSPNDSVDTLHALRIVDWLGEMQLPWHYSVSMEYHYEEILPQDQGGVATVDMHDMRVVVWFKIDAPKDAMLTKLTWQNLRSAELADH